MYYDLNVPFVGSTQAELTDRLIKLGYHGIALNHTTTKLQPQDAQALKDVSTSNPPSSTLQIGTCTGATLQKYKRITITLQDVSQARTLSSPPTNQVLNAFDIIAVVPQDEKTFNLACTALDIDIIVVDTSHRLPFILRTPSVRSAISKGIHFEISLGPALRDVAIRRHFFANFSALVRVTRGQSLLISGEALHPTDLRAPDDVANLCSLFGLDFALAKAALSSSAISIIRRGEARKASRGVLRVAVEHVATI